MRGRTLNEAFIILDEAQNTTIPQMKMFLTRLGFALAHDIFCFKMTKRNFVFVFQYFDSMNQARVFWVG
jgi:hypothetical protein